MVAYTFKGRVKPKEDKPNLLQLVELSHERKSFVYQRLSSHEQVKKSIFSVQMQDGLEDLASEDGYKTSLTKEEVQVIRNDPDYPGYYINGQIIIEQRDLGISGTLGPEGREGLAHLIQRIESDEIESIFVVHISRLFRDQTLIDGLSFGELCKKHNVVMVIPNMRLNLRDKMHMRIYRMELERSADELEVMNLRMGGARKLKAKQGYYASGSVPIGYILDRDKLSRSYDKYIVYEPHAAIVRKVFRLIPEMKYSYVRVALKLRRDGVVIPYFSSDLQYMETRSATKLMKSDEHGKGYQITSKFVARAVSNPAYIGWWIWGGEIINKDNHPPILDEGLFWQVQEGIKALSKGRAAYSEQFMLEGLLYCEKHLAPSKLYPDHRDGRYRCSGDYKRTLQQSYCVGVSTKLLEEPIGKFVLSQCAYPKYAEKIIHQLRSGYDEAKEKADSNKREFTRLTTEINNLKENLAFTKSKGQVEMLLGMIDEKIKEKERLSKVNAYPAGRVGKAINIEQITKFLSNIESIWQKQPTVFKNEFLQIILDRILVDVNEENIMVRIIWKTGWEQAILIQRPPMQSMKSNRWTENEKIIIRQHFARTGWNELFKMLPGRSYSAILGKGNKLGLKRIERNCKRGAAWKNSEDELLQEVAARKISIEDAGKKLNRTPSAIYLRMIELRISASSFDKRSSDIEWEVVDPGSSVNGNQRQRSRTRLSP